MEVIYTRAHSFQLPTSEVLNVPEVLHLPLLFVVAGPGFGSKGPGVHVCGPLFFEPQIHTFLFGRLERSVSVQLFPTRKAPSTIERLSEAVTVKMTVLDVPEPTVIHSRQVPTLSAVNDPDAIQVPDAEVCGCSPRSAAGVQDVAPSGSMAQTVTLWLGAAPERFSVHEAPMEKEPPPEPLMVSVCAWAAGGACRNTKSAKTPIQKAVLKNRLPHPPKHLSMLRIEPYVQYTYIMYTAQNRPCGRHITIHALSSL